MGGKNQGGGIIMKLVFKKKKGPGGKNRWAHEFVMSGNARNIPEFGEGVREGGRRKLAQKGVDKGNTNEKESGRPVWLGQKGGAKWREKGDGCGFSSRRQSGWGGGEKTKKKKHMEGG